MPVSQTFLVTTFIIYVHVSTSTATSLTTTKITSTVGPCPVSLPRGGQKLCERSVGRWVTKGPPLSLPGVEINIRSCGWGGFGNHYLCVKSQTEGRRWDPQVGEINPTFTHRHGCRHNWPGLQHDTQAPRPSLHPPEPDPLSRKLP